jgi:poly-beta-1,6-N-acetyl-D-glucosamine synthase
MDDSFNMKQQGAYVLVTAAFNEEAYIDRTIQAVIQQTHPPQKWVIVSDASWDRTDQIVREYADNYGFIELLRMDEKHVHNFASKVNALNKGIDCLKGLDYAFIGILDADVSFERSYFGLLIEEFAGDPGLGLAGGFIHEERKGRFSGRASNSTSSVAGAIQLFRRECFDTFGCFLPLKYGGEDWCAELTAKMNGWRVESYPALKVFHHKRIGARARGLRPWYREGLADFSLGSHPLFEVFKCLRRIGEEPYVLGALARFSGFVSAYCRKEKRGAPMNIVEYLRNEQKARLRDLLP